MKILELLTDRRITGNIGERAAARRLRKDGYRILERNFVSDGHEIDIIAESKDTIAFVEVKTRTLGRENPREPRPASAVDQKKQRSIIGAAIGYLSMHKTEKRKRFDIIEVYLTEDGKKRSVAEIKHLENCFNRNTAYRYTRKD